MNLTNLTTTWSLVRRSADENTKWITANDTPVYISANVQPWAHHKFLTLYVLEPRTKTSPSSSSSLSGLAKKMSGWVYPAFVHPDLHKTAEQTRLWFWQETVPAASRARGRRAGLQGATGTERDSSAFVGFFLWVIEFWNNKFVSLQKGRDKKIQQASHSIIIFYYFVLLDWQLYWSLI